MDRSTSFTRDHRLLKPGDYRNVFSRPKKLSNRFFTVLVRPNGLQHPRLGMAISKKVVKKAVARNRLKRIVRESFRHNRAKLESLDIVVLARKGADKSLISVNEDPLAVFWSDLLRG